MPNTRSKGDPLIFYDPELIKSIRRMNAAEREAQRLQELADARARDPPNDDHREDEHDDDAEVVLNNNRNREEVEEVTIQQKRMTLTWMDLAQLAQLFFLH